MSWILQGNPKLFAIDAYLTRYPRVYWNVSTNRQDSRDDRVFIWRARRPGWCRRDWPGAQAACGAARGAVPRGSRRRGAWVSPPTPLPEVRVGLTIEEVRLRPEDGMLTRVDLRHDPVLAQHSIIRAPRRTVFALSAEERAVLEQRWGGVHGEGRRQPRGCGPPSPTERRRDENAHVAQGGRVRKSSDNWPHLLRRLPPPVRWVSQANQTRHPHG